MKHDIFYDAVSYWMLIFKSKYLSSTWWKAWRCEEEWENEVEEKVESLMEFGPLSKAGE